MLFGLAAFLPFPVSPLATLAFCLIDEIPDGTRNGDHLRSDLSLAKIEVEAVGAESFIRPMSFFFMDRVQALGYVGQGQRRSGILVQRSTEVFDWNPSHGRCSYHILSQGRPFAPEPRWTMDTIGDAPGQGPNSILVTDVPHRRAGDMLNDQATNFMEFIVDHVSVSAADKIAANRNGP
ncbi:hypothetical protein Y958_04805 [Nitrospirillum viridazoti CBAmc]|uniref:Uncharacterized protein n=1 Tax=Nitrospirillum viridazoti CBAmc TaxID=1441467 RepID=A0A248JN93_9PROT|nr:hypothetical protein Y958_04805 [Nitrospirillum amazonense CBAmc]